MKYPCHLIEDLLPLYYDGVCSEKSNEDIKEHLSECAGCSEKYRALSEPEKIENVSIDQEYEMQRAASFRSVKRKITINRIAAILICVVIFAAMFLTYVIMQGKNIFVDADDITVSMNNGAIIAQVQGNDLSGARSKQVIIEDENGKTEYVFFNISTSVWGKMVTSKDRTWDYTVRYADGVNNRVNYVYYYTGDYTGIEMLSRDELQEIIDRSVLLWKK